MDTPAPEPTWFNDDGEMNLEAPQEHVASDFARKMAEAEISRQHKTTLIEGEFDQDVRVINHEDVLGAVHTRALIYDSARTGCFLIPHRQVEIFLRATRHCFDVFVSRNPQLQAALADGRIEANIRKSLPAGSRLGLFMVAAGHGWSPEMLAKHLIVEEAIRAGGGNKGEQLDTLRQDKDRL